MSKKTKTKKKKDRKPPLMTNTVGDLPSTPAVEETPKVARGSDETFMLYWKGRYPRAAVKLAVDGALRVYFDCGVAMSFTDVFGNAIAVPVEVANEFVFRLEEKELKQIASTGKLDDTGVFDRLIQECRKIIPKPIFRIEATFVIGVAWLDLIIGHTADSLSEICFDEEDYDVSVWAGEQTPECIPVVGVDSSPELMSLVEEIDAMNGHFWAPHPDTHGGLWSTGGHRFRSDVCVRCAWRRTEPTFIKSGAKPVYRFDEEIPELEW